MDNRERWEERNWIILSLIRFHSMVNLEPESVQRVLDIAGSLRCIEENGGHVCDNELLDKYYEGCEML